MENKNCKNMIRQGITEMANSSYKILETFLLEYCKVNSVGKKDVGSHLHVKQDLNKGVTAVVYGDKDLLRLTFISVNSKEDTPIIDYDVYLFDKVTYKETLSLIRKAA